MLNQISNTTAKPTYTFSLSQISHEIGNPLTLIYSTTQLLSHKYPELTQDELWRQLINDIDYLKQLNASLSTFNHCDRLNIQPADIHLLLADLKSTWTSFASQTERTLLFDIQPALPAIDCDIIKLKQCLINLIKNSFEATQKKGIIKITVSLKHDLLEITVSDTGKGIPANQLHDIFEPFKTYKSDGTGLGLAITRRIITAHNGTIKVNSQSGGGTCFTIHIPQHQM